MSFEGPLFLVGMPRSGTKLLRDLLNRHPKIGIPDLETEFLPWLANGFMRFGDLSDAANFDRFYREMMRQTYFRMRVEWSSPVASDDWYAACRSFDAAGVFEALIRLEVGAPSGSGRIWGDKSPSYMDDLPLLKTLFPAARIIHIVRDVRDYCLSMQKAWGKDILRAAQRWVDDIDAARHAGQRLGNSYIELRYEDLLDDPREQLGRLCNFLDVEFVDSMSSLTRPTENLGETQGASHIVSENYGKYVTRMPRTTLARVEAIGGRTLGDLGYVLTMEPQEPARLTVAELQLARARDAWNLLWGHRGHRSLLQSLRFHLRYYWTTRR